MVHRRTALHISFPFIEIRADCRIFGSFLKQYLSNSKKQIINTISTATTKLISRTSRRILSWTYPSADLADELDDSVEFESYNILSKTFWLVVSFFLGIMWPSVLSYNIYLSITFILTISVKPLNTTITLAGIFVKSNGMARIICRV